MLVLFCFADLSGGGHNVGGLGSFEPEVRIAARRASPESPIDLRVAKAVGSKGYDKVRVSVISPGGGSVSLQHLDPDAYNDTFRYRWEASFDLGVAHTACGASGVYNHSYMKYDADCLLACTHDDRCRHYTWYDGAKACELATACSYEAAPLAQATYSTPGRNVLASAVVSLSPGDNELHIGGHTVSIHLPAEGAGVRGVVISDPCYSGRWVGCQWGQEWDTLNRTSRMLNALAAGGDLDFFGILGDNFYDQDGRLTKALWNTLSLDFKRRYLLTTPGNHDIWVPGGPPGDQYDQYGWGFAQFYGQDSIASTTAKGGLLDFEGGGPDVQRDWGGLNNNASNFFFYHSLGNLGFIGYNGGATAHAQLAYFTEACAYMGRARPAAVLLLGHWNDASSGCPSGADVPEVRESTGGQ